MRSRLCDDDGQRVGPENPVGPGFQFGSLAGYLLFVPVQADIDGRR